MKTDITIKKGETTLDRPVVPVGLGIQGLEEEDPSILPIPFVRIVQGQSKDVQTKEGKEAPEGTFFFNDTKESMDTLVFVILKSKVVITEFERDGGKKPTTQRKILGMTMDTKKLFILTIGVGSFSRYSRLVAEMKQRNVLAVWDRIITATTEKTENDKGKFYVINFALGDVLTDDDQIEMGLAFEQYKNIFDKKEPEGEALPFE